MGKILCLHGYAQSGSVFAKKSSGVRKMLAKIGYETLYPTAPIKLSAADELGDLTQFNADNSADTFSWWGEVLETEYAEIDKTWKFLTNVIENEGPFVGILGFSQGTILASMLVNKIKELVPNHPPLQFAIFYSGYKSPLKAYEYLYKNPIDIPTIHIIGTLDTVVPDEKSESLIEACVKEKTTVIRHPGGHYVPNSKPMVSTLSSWIQDLYKPKESDTDKNKNDLDDLDALADQIGK